MSLQVDVDDEALAAFCRSHSVTRLSLFGSVLRPDFSPGSDIDVLVEFKPGSRTTFFDIVRMEDELSPLFGGRRIDLRTAEDLSRYFRADVLREAEPHFVA